MKKILLFLFALLICDVVHASHLDLVPISNVYSNQINIDTGSYFSSNQKKYYIDGRIVYCVEPGAPIYTNEYSGVSDLYSSGYDFSIIDSISLIGYFGYDYPGHNNDSYFLAAQELIWETVGSNEVYFTTKQNGLGDMVNVDIEKNRIMSLVNHYFVKPSFDSDLISGVYNDEIILVDSNNVLSNYEIVSTNNDVVIDGNRLIIKFNKLGSDEIVLKKKKYDDFSSIFYMDQISQDFMYLRAPDVYSSLYVESFVPFSTIDLSKSGLLLSDYKDGNFIYSLSKLSNVVFGLYASDDIYVGDELIYYSDQMVQELTTNSDYVSSIELPNGNYYLKELSTLDEFIISNERFPIHLENYEKEVKKYMVDFENERKEVFISLNKYGEFFGGVDSKKGIYGVEPLSGIKFGLYNSCDIYSSFGDLLVKKDTLLQEFLTDDDGHIFESVTLPFGQYYMKELQTEPGYKLDDSVYKFSVYGNSNSIQVDVTKEPIVNELIKGSLVINKIDENGNGLGGALFRVLDDFGNIVFEGITDSDGVICIDDLPYGKYHFYEIKAPYGYYVNDYVYDINILEDNSLVSVDVINNMMPITSNIYEFPKKFSMVGLGFGVFSLSMELIYEKRFKVY